MTISGLTIVYLSAVDWDAPWHGPQEIAVRLGAAGNRVLYVETLGWRRPRPADLPRVARRAARALPRPGARGAASRPAAPPGVEILSPALIPGVRSPVGVAANRALLLRAVRRRLGLVTGPLVLWIYTPSALSATLPGALGENLCLYHCTQSHRHRPLAPRGTARAEARLLDRADLVVTDGIALHDERAGLNPFVYRIPSGVDPGPFEDARPPAWMDGLPQPVIGYLGSIDNRIDPGLLAAAADAHPRGSLVLVGPVADIDVAGLRARPNVVIHPQVPIGEVPGVLAGFDVGLMPYADIPMTRYTYPAKLHQYLAAGLPIASVPLPDLDDLGDLVSVGAGDGGFAAAVEGALAGPRRADERRIVAAANTWQHRVDALSDVLRGHLDGHPPPGGPRIPARAPGPPPPSAPPRLSLVVLTWNERDDLARCLDAVAAEPGAEEREVIVVDNGSTDGTMAMLAERHPDVRVHRNRRNAGVAAGRNQGLRLARGRIVGMLDSDAVVRPGALGAVCDFLEAHPDVGLVGPRLVYGDGSLQMSCRRVPTAAAVLANRLTAVPGLAGLPARRRYLMLDGPHDATMDVEYVLGAAMFFPRAVVGRIGLFDVRSTPFGFGFDDADWGIRVRRAGLRVVYLPAAEVVHGYRRRAARRPLTRQSAGLVAGYAVLRARHRGRWR